MIFLMPHSDATQKKHHSFPSFLISNILFQSAKEVFSLLSVETRHQKKTFSQIEKQMKRNK